MGNNTKYHLSKNHASPSDKFISSRIFLLDYINNNYQMIYLFEKIINLSVKIFKTTSGVKKDTWISFVERAPITHGYFCHPIFKKPYADIWNWCVIDALKFILVAIIF